MSAVQTDGNARYCPYCGAQSKVRDIRDWAGAPRRVRKCALCGLRWVTVEKIVRIMEKEDKDDTQRFGKEATQ